MTDNYFFSSKATRAERGNAEFELCGTVSATLVLIVILVLLLVFYYGPFKATRRVTASPCSSVTYTLNASCVPPIETSTCTVGYRVSAEIDACVQQQAAPNTTCTNECYVSEATTTTCDSHGECKGQVTECRGYCTTDEECDTAIPYDTRWDDTLAYFEENERIVWSNRSMCVFNRCTLAVLDMFEKEPASNYPVNIGSWAECQDYLEPDFVAERQNCIRIERYLIDTNLTAPQYYENNTETPSQFSLCMYYYACADLNQTAIGLASAEAQGASTQSLVEQNRFVFATSTTNAEKAPVLSSSARYLMWSMVNETITTLVAQVTSP
jgi:hypothetical protein